MNKSNAHLYLPLVQALADGKVIQRRDFGENWACASELDFTWAPDRYRIKPEPREGWIVVTGADAFMSEDTARHLAGSRHEAIHVREVLPP